MRHYTDASHGRVLGHFFDLGFDFLYFPSRYPEGPIVRAVASYLYIVGVWTRMDPSKTLTISSGEIACALRLDHKAIEDILGDFEFGGWLSDMNMCLSLKE